MTEMIKLNKLIIKCFMKHEYLELDFYDDINLITGDTASGKSCIFKAIRWLYGDSSISKDDFRKEGTKSTEVIGFFNNGYEVERVRSNTVNSYLVRKEGMEDKKFDSFGKEIPDEIKAILGTEVINIDDIKLDLNFADQEDLNFIFGKEIPASFCSKLFNKLTGSELLDNLFSLCNKESLSVKKEIKNLESNIEKNKEDIVFCQTKYDELNKKNECISALYAVIKEKSELFKKLKSIFSCLKENKENLTKILVESFLITNESSV